MIQLLRNRLTIAPRFMFAKQPKEKDDKNDKGKAAGNEAIVQQPEQQLSIPQILAEQLNAKIPSLSPSELNMLSSGFEDIPSEHRKILDRIANEIARLKTPLFYQVCYRQKGGLGIVEALAVGTQDIDEQEIIQGIRKLRKQE